MARRKGSKNRTTLERELAEAGVKEDLAKLSYDELTAKVDTIPRPATPSASPEPAEQTIVAPEFAKTIIDDTRRRFQLMVDYYAKEGDTPPAGDRTFVPERIQDYLRGKVFMAASVEEARDASRRALDKLHVHLLGLWRHKRVSGPDTPQNIQKRAKRAEKWAKRLDKLGRHEEAKIQREKVAAILATPLAGGTPWGG